MSDRLNTSYSGSMYNSEMRPLDYLYGPWNSIDELLQELHVTVEEIEPGLTIGIIEDGKVVEYWNPTDEGFVKKRMGGMSGSFSTYEDALEHATSDNLGSLFLVEGENGGLYMVTGEGELELMEYGEFPEDEDMGDDEVLTVSKDGMAKVSDVYRRMKKIQLRTIKKLDHTHKFAHDIVSDLDKPDPHDDDKLDDHMFIQRLENTEGKITIKREPLDTDRLVMNGDYIKDESETGKDDEFIRVRGTIVGNYKPGDVITNSTSLDEVLKNMLDKELNPKDSPILPTLTLSIEPNEKTYEVGSRPEITLSTIFNDGKISTFMDENSLEPVYVDAGCVSEENTLKYSVKKPGSDEFENIENVFNEVMVEGKYVFKAEMNYSGNSVKPVNNKGVKLTGEEYNISDGIASSEEKESTVHLKYKMWCLMTDEYLAIDNDDSDTSFDIENYEQGETWFSGEDVLINSITLKNKYIYVICPIEYKVVFDTQIAKNIEASKGVTYDHTLPNGETKQYRLWYMLNDGYYENVRFELDGDHSGDSGDNNGDDEPKTEPETPESGTVLWGDFFGTGSTIEGSNFTDMMLVEEYQKEDIRLYNPDDKDTIVYTADSENNVKLSKTTAGNMSEAHLWFNKSKDGVFTVSGIKLYGVTQLTLTYKQTKGETYSYYKVNGTGVEYPIGHNKLTTPDVTTNDITIPKGTETISISIKHLSSNTDNTRVDDIELKVK